MSRPIIPRAFAGARGDCEPTDPALLRPEYREPPSRRQQGRPSARAFDRAEATNFLTSHGTPSPVAAKLVDRLSRGERLQSDGGFGPRRQRSRCLLQQSHAC